MSDSQIERYTSIPAPTQNVFEPPRKGASALKATEPLTPFTPIFASMDGGGNLLAGPAVADGSSNGNCVGLTSGSFTAAEVVEYSLVGALLSTIEVIAASLSASSEPAPSGGLIPGRVYYLDQIEAGKITNVKPLSGQVIQIGTAFAPAGLALQIGEPSAAPGSAGDTVEHIETVANTAAADPEVGVSFVKLGAGADALQNITLADGTSDGFQKRIAIEIDDGIAVVSWKITCANGPTINFPHSALADGGGASLVWDDDAGVWVCVGAFGT